ncbi:MAG: bifunctional diaminohydroxyphosphoribosylaminopyrimidine deaminase/5-amino-6-(5-phosphoribosylamino)uracil reductase RibD [Oleiphilaceae bacterium]|nr:bifunctional diaminohydroxyphosphoribosylaminopyrimidine deaminase/5-amino-6-(5-phosphoribosylamino)uracil reductase RibD [Oleiphilaceae bacterium]
MPQESWTADDHRFMARAIQLAEQGLYTTPPNPRVGCVLVKHGSIIAEGWHQKAGQAHAEVLALRAAGEAAQGATAYVTLEPCSHHGRTGPCAEALVKANVAQVVAAMQDPNPLVAGQGFALLQKAGIATRYGLMQGQAEALNPGFISRMARQRPWVRLKLAASADGRTAMASGESKWITGSAARSDVQRLRARSCALITGAGTVLHDNPAMTVRQDQLGLEQAAEIVARQPLRVVLDDAAALSGNEQIFSEPGRVIYVAREGSPVRPGLASKQHVAVWATPAEQTRQVQLQALLARLAAEEQCNEVLVEAGAGVAGAFVEAGLVDELWLYMAPVLMGNEARPLVRLPITTMAERQHLVLDDAVSIGADLRLRYRIANNEVEH